MKVYGTIGVDIQDGKTQQAWEFAIKLVNYINDHFPGAKTEVLQQVGGGTSRVVFLSQHDSLAAYEAHREKVEADAGRQQLIDEGTEQGLFITSSIRSGIFRIRS